MTTLLLVEDDPKIARAMKVRLKHSGHTVRVANDVPTALMIARKNPPDVAILDISLPGGNGIQLARNLQEIVEDRILPVIFITASKEQCLKEEASRLDASAFLEKPFAAKNLLAAIDDALIGKKHDMDVCQAQRI